MSKRTHLVLNNILQIILLFLELWLKVNFGKKLLSDVGFAILFSDKPLDFHTKSLLKYH